ncbi:MAG: tRNA threonylcarbamoyladenosine dehydratase [Oscillospiraceae bacterium]|nr:tRNA threonylcarbamoyladenosine dehydratase [Oscillospiraceae bacterium]
MLNQFSRTQMLLGDAALERLKNARVAIFGIGGVGGYALEALARSGVGAFDLFDDDKICVTNINRQIHATLSTVGQYKTDAAKARVLDINPAAAVRTHKMFYLPENAQEVDLSQFDYVIDAIDTVSGKIELAVRCHQQDTPIISSMGAGNKLDPTAFEVADIYQTSVCPLARVMRRELKGQGVPKLKVVYSREAPLVPEQEGGCETGCVCPPDTQRKCTHRRQIPGSAAFVPSVVGLICAGEVIKHLTNLQ